MGWREVAPLAGCGGNIVRIRSSAVQCYNGRNSECRCRKRQWECGAVGQAGKLGVGGIELVKEINAFDAHRLLCSRSVLLPSLIPPLLH